MEFVIETMELTMIFVFKPMDFVLQLGALEPKRLASATKRYKEMVFMDDNHLVPFMWGSHYSTAGYVLHFLAREAPELMLKLQSGDFDKPDRLFTSVARTWRGPFLHSK